MTHPTSQEKTASSNHAARGDSDHAAISAHVPMKPVWHQILLAIATGHEHGYGIREAVEERTSGAMRLWPTTLYGTLQRMTEAGLLEEHAVPDDPRRKRVFSLTAPGRAVPTAAGSTTWRRASARC